MCTWAGQKWDEIDWIKLAPSRLSGVLDYASAPASCQVSGSKQHVQTAYQVQCPPTDRRMNEEVSLEGKWWNEALQ